MYFWHDWLCYVVNEIPVYFSVLSLWTKVMRRAGFISDVDRLLTSASRRAAKWATWRYIETSLAVMFEVVRRDQSQRLVLAFSPGAEAAE